LWWKYACILQFHKNRFMPPSISRIYSAFTDEMDVVFSIAARRSRGGIVVVQDVLSALRQRAGSAADDFVAVCADGSSPQDDQDQGFPMSNSPKLRTLLRTALEIAENQENRLISAEVMWAALFRDGHVHLRQPPALVFDHLRLRPPIQAARTTPAMFAVTTTNRPLRVVDPLVNSRLVVEQILDEWVRLQSRVEKERAFTIIRLLAAKL